MNQQKPLTITASIRTNGTKLYIIRYTNDEKVKVVENNERRRAGMGKDDWLEEALNWAFEQGMKHARQ